MPIFRARMTRCLIGGGELPSRPAFGGLLGSMGRVIQVVSWVKRIVEVVEKYKYSLGLIRSSGASGSL